MLPAIEDRMADRDKLTLRVPIDPEIEEAIRAYRDAEPPAGKPATRRERRRRRAKARRAKVQGHATRDPLAILAAVVKRRLREAGRTLRRIQLPSDYARLRNLRVCWPEMKRELFKDAPKDSTPTLRPRPTPYQIDRLDECLGWLMWLDREPRMLIGAWMLSHPWDEIEAAFGFSRWTGARRIDAACREIAVRLASGEHPG